MAKELELLLEHSEGFKGIVENKPGKATSVFDIYFKLNGVPCSGITKADGKFIASETFHPLFAEIIKKAASDNALVVKLTAVDEGEVFRKYVSDEKLEKEKHFRWPKMNFISSKDFWDSADDDSPRGGYYVCFEAKERHINSLINNFWSRKISWLDYGSFTGIILEKGRLNAIPTALSIHDVIKQARFLLDNSNMMMDNVDYGYKMRITTENYSLDSLKQKIGFEKLSKEAKNIELLHKEGARYVGDEVSTDGTLIRQKFI